MGIAMKPRTLLALLLALPLLLPLTASAESLSGSLAISGGNINGTLHFTALAPGELTSAYAPLAGFTSGSATLYTYVYLLENNSAVAGDGGFGFGDLNAFTDLDLTTVVDPQTDMSNISWQGDGPGGREEPSFVDFTTTPNDIDYQFDNEPNFGIAPGGESVFLYFHSSLGPTASGGAIITNNNASPQSANVTSGVTTPGPAAVPEPATIGLLAAGLAALGRRRRR
jgi:hypothetical protein